MVRLFPMWLAFVLVLAAPHPLAAQSLLDRLGGLLPQEPQPPAAAEPAPQRAPARGYLGLAGDEVEGESGVLVVDVEPGTPAEQAGFQEGDLIINISGTKITGMTDMARLLQRRRAGDRLEFTILREGREHKLTATLAADRVAAGREQGEELPPADIRIPQDRGAVLGVTAAPVTEELRNRYGFSVEEGAVIAGIEPGSPAHRQRLPIGGVIVDVNGLPIHGPEDLRDLVASSRAGDELEIIYYIGMQRYRTKLRLAPGGMAPPVEARRGAPLPQTPEPPGARSGELENRLGEGGRRPLLGRIGRVIDDLVDEPPPAVAPGDAAAAAPPVGDDVEALGEAQLLREEVELLRREISLLRRRIEELERKLAR